MMLLSPNPFSLLCAVLLCLPLAFFFTLSSHSHSLSSSSSSSSAVSLTRLNLVSPHPHPLKPTPSPSPTPTSKSKTPQLKNPSESKTRKQIPPPPPPPPTTRGDASQPSVPVPPPPPPPTTPPFWVEEEKADSHLLRRASRVDPSSTREGPRKVAFLFLTTTPLPFAPLWERFFNEDGAKGKYNVYIHADPGYEYDNPPFSGVFSGRVIPSSRPTRRNTPTLVSAARRLLAHALLDDSENFMFALLSDSCIPLHSFNFTYATLAGSASSFIEVLSNETTAYSRWVARGDDAMLPEVGLEVFRIGSQFWSLTRRHARVVVGDVRLWKKFALPCVTPDTCFPEENYFPTLLSMVDPNGVVPATLTNVNWEGQFDGHPRTYNGSEVGPELIQWLRETRPRYGDVGTNGSDQSRSDPFLFARKFAPNCVEPLMSLAQDVLFKD